MKKIKSFTLAEVLITLVVIGIIAAITVPVVMANHRRTETAARVKKFYSMMSEVVARSEIESGLKTYEWFQEGYGVCNDYDNSTEFYEKYILPYISYMKVEKLGEGNSYYDKISNIPSGKELLNNVPAYYLNDGSILFVNECNELVGFDANGEKGPNEWGRDIFNFYYLAYLDGDYGLHLANIVPHFNTRSFDVIPWEDGYSTSREQLKTKCASTTSWDYRSKSCTDLLQLDGWEFKEDYPLRI